MSRTAKNEGSASLCTSRHFLIPIQGPGKVLEISISSDWLFRHPCAPSALGSSVALGSSYWLDLLCTLCQNLYILFYFNFNSTKCLFVASTGISGKVIAFRVYWFWFTGSSCCHLLLVHSHLIHFFCHLIKWHVWQNVSFHFVPFVIFLVHFIINLLQGNSKWHSSFIIVVQWRLLPP